MFRRTKKWFIRLVWASVLCTGQGLAQSVEGTVPPTVPSAPGYLPQLLQSPEVSGTQETLPNPRPLAQPMNSYSGVVSSPGGETGILAPAGQQTGWFFNVEAGLIKPHINSHLTSAENLPFDNPVQLPVAPLNWTGVPYFQLGYRLEQGAGDLLLGYTFAVSQGNSTLPGFDAAGNGVLHSRLDINRVDLRYLSSEYLAGGGPSLLRNIRAGLGLSIADVFFDSQAQGQQILAQQASSNFVGLGPNFEIEWRRAISQTPVWIYARLDAIALFGWTRQHFSETQLTDSGPASAAAVVGPQSNGVGLFNVEGGLSYIPDWQDRMLRLTVGYQWQRWWFLGNTNDSNADLTLQGVFIRGEFCF